MKLQKLGGIAIIVSIFVWIAAVLIYNRFGIPSDPVKAMEAYSTSPVYTNTCLLLISVCYLLLMIFFLALHERMHTDAPYLTCIMLIAISAAAAVGIMDTVVWKTGLDVIVPTRDVSAYRAINAILTGLYNAGYHATMWATLFAGWAILKSRAFSPILGWLSIAASTLAILKFIIPQLGLVYPFYIAYVAIIWMGIETLRKRPNIDNQ